LFLEQPETARQLGQAARQFVAEQQGATAKTMDKIVPLVPIEFPGQGRAA
jgi:hypothetical protein